jgi:cysteine desulfurase
MRTIYLDNAAATPMDESVVAAMQPYWSQNFYNPSATYLKAKAVAKAIEDARGSVAINIGVRPAEIVFTAGGSEANNLAISGVMQRHPGKNVIVSAVEHDSVLKTAQQYDMKQLPVKTDGRVNLEMLPTLISDDTVLISIMYVNNELGTVMPLRKISKVIEDVKTDRRDRNVDTPLYFHTDACQAPLYLDVHAERLGVDMMTLNGSKIYGPKQTGMLYVKTGTEIEPIVRGGGQEWGKRSGTENVSGVIGFCTAFQNARNNTNKDSVSVAALQQLFIKELASFIPNATVNGTTKYRSPNNIHVTFPGFDNERLMMELDEAGILCAVGSACSASSDEPSHVLKAIGMSDQDAQSSLRFTLGKHTTASDIDYAIKTLRKLLTA